MCGGVMPVTFPQHAIAQHMGLLVMGARARVGVLVPIACTAKYNVCAIACSAAALPVKVSSVTSFVAHSAQLPRLSDVVVALFFDLNA